MVSMAAQDKIESSRAMKCALIGCGRIAAKHLEAALINDLEIVALCDIDVKAMGDLVKRVGDGRLSSVRYYTDYRQMLDKHPELELVVVATESGLHASIALECIDAGVNLIIEKPLALSMADANEVVRRAKNRGVRVAVCHQNRFNPAVVSLREAVEGNYLGVLSHGSVSVRWSRLEDYYRQAFWRGTWELDGGALMNQCIHGIDLLCWMMGDDVVEVFGVTRRRQHSYIEGEDVGVAVLSFASGAVGVIEGTVNVYPRNMEETLCIFGETGTVKLRGLAASTIEVWNVVGCDAKRHVCAETMATCADVYGGGHRLLYADMIEAIMVASDPLVDAAAGRRALEVVLAIYKSQKTGGPVKLPLGDFASSDMKDVL